MGATVGLEGFGLNSRPPPGALLASVFIDRLAGDASSWPQWAPGSARIKTP